MNTSRFRWKLFDYRHRLGIDLRTNQFLGLIRNLVLRTRKSRRGKMIPYLQVEYLDEGQEWWCIFEANEVGFLDIHPDICLTSDELLEHLNVFKEDLDAREEILGVDHDLTIAKRGRYDLLVSDVKSIMCANKFFSLHDYQSLMTRHALMGM
jgi:hypothetical protein